MDRNHCEWFSVRARYQKCSLRRYPLSEPTLSPVVRKSGYPHILITSLSLSNNLYLLREAPAFVGNLASLGVALVHGNTWDAPRNGAGGLAQTLRQDAMTSRAGPGGNVAFTLAS